MNFPLHYLPKKGWHTQKSFATFVVRSDTLANLLALFGVFAPAIEKCSKATYDTV